MPLPEASPVGMSAPVEAGTVGNAPRPPVRIGYGMGGLTGVDALMKRRQIMNDADPESKLNVQPDFVEVAPPQSRKGFKGKLKSIGEGLLIGLAKGDPDNPNNILGSAIGGGALGAATNRGEAKLKRRFDLDALDNDIARGLKLEQEQAQLGGMKALTAQREMEPAIKAAELDAKREIENAKLEIERQKALGLITQKEADRQQRELDRKSREDIAAKNRENQLKVAGMRGTANSGAVEGIEQNIQDAQDEQAKIDEGLAQIEEQLKNTPAVDAQGYPNPAHADLLSRAKEGTKRRQELDDHIRTWRTKAKPAPTMQTTYTGRTMSAANLARYAKDKGLTEEEARKKVESEGVKVQ